MKKLGIIFIGLISLLGLASCNNNGNVSYALDEEALKSKIALEWFGQESDYQTTYLNKPEEVDLTKERIEVYAPLDVEAKAKYTIVNLEDVYYNKHVKSVYMTYSSMSSLFNVQSSAVVVTPISDNFDNVIKPEIAFAQNYNSWNNAISFDELNAFEAKENTNRTLEVLYVPYLVKYYMAKKDSNAQHVLTTFVIAPIYYELNYLASNETKVESNNLKNFESYEITFDGNVISSKTE